MSIQFLIDNLCKQLLLSDNASIITQCIQYKYMIIFVVVIFTNLTSFNGLLWLCIFRWWRIQATEDIETRSWTHFCRPNCSMDVIWRLSAAMGLCRFMASSWPPSSPAWMLLTLTSTRSVSSFLKLAWTNSQHFCSVYTTQR